MAEGDEWVDVCVCGEPSDAEGRYYETVSTVGRMCLACSERVRQIVERSTRSVCDLSGGDDG